MRSAHPGSELPSALLYAPVLGKRGGRQQWEPAGGVGHQGGLVLGALPKEVPVHLSA